MITKKKLLLLLILLHLISATLFAKEKITENKKDPLFNTGGYASIIPWSKWYFPDWFESSERFLEYDMDSTRTTTYEADFSFEPLNLTAGLNVSVDDSIIGKILI